jgi:L-gulonolactone oxidase
VWGALRGAAAAARAWLWDRLLGYHALEAALWLSLRVPRLLVPAINAAWGAAMFSAPRAATVRSDAVGGFTFDCLFQQHVSEWALPVAAVPAMLRELHALLGAGAPDLVAHFPLEVRFTAGDDLHLSPAHGRATAWVGTVAYKPYGVDLGGHVRCFDAFERCALRHGGRPHWAKAFGGAVPLRALYPKWDAFHALREALDPRGLFLNEWARDVLARGRLPPPAEWGGGAGGEGEGAWRAVEAPRVRAGVPPLPWTDARAWAPLLTLAGSAPLENTPVV